MEERINPFKGPKAYQKGDRIYGRDKEIFELLNLIELNSLTLLYSKSGIGKTSLINAGLTGSLERVDKYIPLVLRFGSFLDYKTSSINFSHYLIQEMTKELQEKHGITVPELKVKDSLFEFLHLLFYVATPDSEDTEVDEDREEKKAPPIPVIILDQLEVIFTLEIQSGDVDHLISELRYCIESEFPDYLVGLYNPDTDVKKFLAIQNGIKSQIKSFRFLFSFREEYLFDFESCASRIPSIRFSSARYRLLPFDKDIALDVILNTSEGMIPADQANKIIESIIPEKKGNLSPAEVDPFLLSLVCCQLWKPIVGSKLDITHYMVNNVIAEYVLGVYNHLSERAQNFIETYLITANDKRTLFSYELAVLWHIEGDEIDKLIENPDARLLNREMYLDSYHVQILHDRLVPPIAARKIEREQIRIEKIRQEQENARVQEKDKLAQTYKVELLREQKRMRSKRNYQLMTTALIIIALALVSVFLLYRASANDAKENKQFKDALTLIMDGDSLAQLANSKTRDEKMRDIRVERDPFGTDTTANINLLMEAASKYSKSGRTLKGFGVAYERLFDTYFKLLTLDKKEIIDSIPIAYSRYLANGHSPSAIFSRIVSELPVEEKYAVAIITQLLKRDSMNLKTDPGYYRSQMNVLYDWGYDSMAAALLNMIPTNKLDERDFILHSSLSYDKKASLLRCVQQIENSCECKYRLAEVYYREKMIDSTLYYTSNYWNTPKCQSVNSARTLAYVYLGMKEYSYLPELLEYEIKSDTSVIYLNDFAWYLAIDGQLLSLAERLSTKSLELDPKNSHCWDTLAEIYLRQKRIARAKSANTKALNLDPQNTYSLKRKTVLDSLELLSIGARK